MLNKFLHVLYAVNTLQGQSKMKVLVICCILACMVAVSCALPAWYGQWGWPYWGNYYGYPYNAVWQYPKWLHGLNYVYYGKYAGLLFYHTIFEFYIHPKAKEMQNKFLGLSYISGSRSRDPAQIKCAHSIFLQVAKILFKNIERFTGYLEKSVCMS